MCLHNYPRSLYRLLGPLTSTVLIYGPVSLADFYFYGHILKMFDMHANV